LNLNIFVLYKINVARYASPSDLSKVNFKFFAKTQTLELDGGSIMMWPSKCKIQPKFSLYVFCCKLPIICFPLFYLLHATALLCYLSNFTGRTSGHCLFTRRAATFSDPPHFPLSVVHLTTLFSIPIYFSVSIRWCLMR